MFTPVSLSISVDDPVTVACWVYLYVHNMYKISRLGRHYLKTRQCNVVSSLCCIFVFIGLYFSSDLTSLNQSKQGVFYTTSAL